jgi:hypothetical protein
MPRKPADDATRFWALVDKSGGPDACWPWVGPRNQNGYGVSNRGGRTQVASRHALELTEDCRLPRGIDACHTCDNPPCCNPAHLFRDTHAANMADMVAKGRHPSKLSADQVREIRTRYAAGRHGIGAQLAREFQVSDACIHKIVYRKLRQHI